MSISREARAVIEQLIAKWRERARLNGMPPHGEPRWAWKPVGIAQQQCADELSALLADVLGSPVPAKCDCGGIPFHSKHCPVYKAEHAAEVVSPSQNGALERIVAACGTATGEGNHRLLRQIRFIAQDALKAAEGSIPSPREGR